MDCDGHRCVYDFWDGASMTFGTMRLPHCVSRKSGPMLFQNQRGHVMMAQLEAHVLVVHSPSHACFIHLMSSEHSASPNTYSNFELFTFTTSTSKLFIVRCYCVGQVATLYNLQLSSTYPGFTIHFTFHGAIVNMSAEASASNADGTDANADDYLLQVPAGIRNRTYHELIPKSTLVIGVQIRGHQE